MILRSGCPCGCTGQSQILALCHARGPHEMRGSQGNLEPLNMGYVALGKEIAEAVW